MLFAHGGEAHTSAESNSGLLDTIAHQPAWAALLISFFVLLSCYAILSMVHVKLLTRLIALLPVIIVLSLIFFSHNPIVATILLSGGFILTFVLTFTMLSQRK